MFQSVNKTSYLLTFFDKVLTFIVTDRIHSMYENLTLLLLPAHIWFGGARKEFLEVYKHNKLIKLPCSIHTQKCYQRQ